MNGLRMIYRAFLKRTLDLFAAASGLVVVSPFVLTALLVTWVFDGRNPIYFARRVGRGGRIFIMYKIRTMFVDAEKTGVDSTSASDPRITPVGIVLRRLKLDELLQLVNVVKGDMSLVGPRPNVERETRLYTDVEKSLLSVRPGITDFSSIVFSDLAEILRSQGDANIAYNQLVRPWKSRFGLLYVERASFALDIKLLLCTLLSFVSRRTALLMVYRMLSDLAADPALLRVSQRIEPLRPHPPPGATGVVTER